MKKRGGFVKAISSKFKKAGLSTIVVTLILILLSLVAVGIVWVVVRNLLNASTQGGGLQQFALNAKIMSAVVDNNSNNITLTVKRNAGQGELTGISFVFSTGTENEVVTRIVSLNQLEQMNFVFHLNKSVSDFISVSIYPIITSGGKDSTGIILDKYTLGSKKCSPSSCSILGYSCGMWNNGTCGGSLSCGTCSGGYSCNSNGQCVLGSCSPTTCSALGYTCGSGYVNGTCSGSLNCGTCGTGYNCIGGNCVVTSCNTSSSTWQNNQITSQNGGFTIVFNSTPYNNNMDGVFGLSQGAQTNYDFFSVLFRFNSSGYIEASDGTLYGYRSLQLVPYTANTVYNFRILVNLTSQNYSLYVTPNGGSQVLLASNSRFRSSATFINNWGLINIPGGTFSICNFNITSSYSPPCVPTTCSALGYTCGSGYANGTCGGTLSCGTCGTGYNCIGGSCVNGTTLMGWQLDERNTGLARLGINKFTLANYTGSASPAAGTIIRDRRIEFGLDLSAGNITIERCWIYPLRVAVGSNIMTTLFPTPVLKSVIRDSEIDGTGLSDDTIGFSFAIYGENLDVERCYIHDTGSGIWAAGSRSMRIEGNYIHNLTIGYNAGMGGWSHTDGITIRGFTGDELLIQNNHILANTSSCTGPLFLQATWADSFINNVTARNNFLEGDGWLLILQWSNGRYGTNNTFVNNRFNWSGYVNGYGSGYVDGGPGWSEWRDNYVNEPAAIDNKGTSISEHKAATTGTIISPSSLQTTLIQSNVINLAWLDNSNNELGFRIERSLNNILFNPKGFVGAGVTSYSDTNVSTNTTYYYRVAGYNAAGLSGFSNVINPRTP